MLEYVCSAMTSGIWLPFDMFCKICLLLCIPIKHTNIKLVLFTHCRRNSWLRGNSAKCKKQKPAELKIFFSWLSNKNWASKGNMQSMTLGHKLNCKWNSHEELQLFIWIVRRLVLANHKDWRRVGVFSPKNHFCSGKRSSAIHQTFD